MASNELIIKIGAEAKQFTDELDKIKKQTAELERGLAKVAKISAAGFIALAGGVALAVKQFSKFEKTFTNVVTLLDESSFKTKSLTKGIDSLKKGVLSLGAETGESFEVLNDGLFNIVSAGIDAEDAIDTLKIATDLAAAGATDTSIAVDGLTSAINAFGLQGKDAQAVAEKFFLAQKAGKTTVEELSSGFGLAAATASAFGVSLDEMLASVSAATLGGIKTRQAYTGLNAALSNISQPTEAASREAARLGIAFDTQALRAKGLQGFLDDLTGSTNFNQQSIEKLFGSIEAKKFVFAIAGSQAKSFADQIENLGDKSKLALTFQNALEAQQLTADKAFQKLGRSVEAMSIVLGAKFAPTIIKVADSLGAMAKRVSELDDEQISAIAGFIKASAAILAVVTATATAAVAFLKLRLLVKGLRLAFIGLRAGALATGTVLTAGLLPVILTIASFLPEIIDGFKALFGLLDDGTDAKSIQTIDNELQKLGKTLENNKRIAEETGKDPTNSLAVRQIQERIDKLEELREARLKANQKLDNGQEIESPFLPDFSQDPVDVPIRPAVEPTQGNTVLAPEVDPAVAAAEVAAVQKKEDDKAKVRTEAEQARIDQARAQNELLAAEVKGASQLELDILRETNEIKALEKENEGIKDEELHQLNKENIALRNEDLALQREEFDAQETDARLKFQEFNQNQENVSAAKKQENNKKFGKLSLKDRQKLNENLAILDKKKQALEAQRNQQAIGFAQATGDAIIAITGDNAIAGIALAKAFAIADVFIKDGQARAAATTAAAGASAAAGPAAPEVFAATLASMQSTITSSTALALGTIAAQTVAQVSRSKKAAGGGFVPSAGGGARDRVNMFLEPDELVVPKTLTPDFIQSVGRPDPVGNEESEGKSTVDINIQDDAVDFITARQREDNDLSVGIAGAA